MKKEYSPWHPNFDYVESIAKKLYRSVKVTFETVRDPFTDEKLVDYAPSGANYGFINGEPVIVMPEIDDDVFSPNYGQRLREAPAQFDVVERNDTTPKFDYKAPDLSPFLPPKEALRSIPAPTPRAIPKVTPVDIPVSVAKVEAPKLSKGIKQVSKTPFSLAELDDAELPPVESIKNLNHLFDGEMKPIEAIDSELAEELEEWDHLLDGI